jgi:hypothetical protein
MNRIKSLAVLLVGLFMAVAGWGIEQGMESWQDMNWGSLSMFMVAGGVVISWLGKPPKQAHDEDK